MTNPAASGSPPLAAAASRPLVRCSTGIKGLDDILDGGFPANRLYLIQGDPGAGKTTMALQFLQAGVAIGETCLYISLSETQEELRAVAASHGWTLDGIALFDLSSVEDQYLLQSQNTLLHPSELELSETTKRLLAEIERLSPTRVVFDSLSEVRLLSQTALRYRRQLLGLKTFFVGRKSTVLMLDDNSSDAADMQIESIAHGVVKMEQVLPAYGVERRRLSVTKLRGSPFRGGYHDYVVRTGGLDVFPRLIAAEHHHTFAREHLSSDVPDLDTLCGGGVDRGTSTLIMGPAGTGKSSVAAQFACAAAARGQKSALYMFDEVQETTLARADGLGLPLRRYMAAGLITLQQIDSAELSPGEFVHTVRRAVSERKVCLVIIDSLNGYLNAMPDERYLITQLHELFAYLSQLGVATMVILAQHGLVGRMESTVDLTYLADMVMTLRYFEANGSVKKAVAVMKKRSGPHESTIREFRLDPGRGVRVGQALTEFQGVLTGTPQYVGGADAMMADRRPAEGRP
jgi:circadian clock protein KaiC